MKKFIVIETPDEVDNSTIRKVFDHMMDEVGYTLDNIHVYDTVEEVITQENR
jgi:hypothetical protein